jgi:YidC/Oxa1 family membrane protein insertase
MDRRQLTALLLVGAAFLFFMSDTWHKTVRKVFGMPEPAPVAASIKPGASKPVDTTAAGLPVLKEALGASGSLVDSANSAHKDTLKVPTRTVTVRTSEMVLRLSSVGGKIEGIQLLNTKSYDGKNPWILPEDRGGALGLKIGETDLAQQNFRFQDSLPDSVNVAVGATRTITLTWESGARKLVRTYTFSGKGEKVEIGFQAANLGEDYRLSWKAGIRQIEPPGPRVPFGPPEFNQIVWKDIDEVSNYSDKKSKSVSGQTSWLGLRSKYALTAVAFATPRDGDADFDTVANVDGDQHSYAWSFRGHMTNGQEKATLIVTPLEMSRLKALKGDFEKVLFNGWAFFFRADIWFPKLCGFVLWLLVWFHGIVPNYGIAIVLLTLVARSVLLPLTLKQSRQAKRMAAVMPIIKPRLEAVKEKYKDDARKQQEETMKVYAEAGINPLASLAGCLPLLLQMPVFISLYTVLGRAIELRGQPFYGWITDLAHPDVVYAGLKIPFIFPMGITILPVFMGLSMYFLNKQTIKDPQQQALVYVMPVMMLVFSGSMPSGLVLYWTISNVYSVLQTMAINVGVVPTELAIAPAPVKKPKGKKR